MHIVKYKDIQRHSASEQAGMLMKMAMEEDDNTIGVDLGDDVVGFFRIETTDVVDELRFSEWANITGEEYFDAETEGDDYTAEDVLSLIEHRLQMFHQAF